MSQRWRIHGGWRDRLAERLSIRLGFFLAFLMSAALLLNSPAMAEANSSEADSTPHHGGTLTVLENETDAGTWPSGLDPLTDASGNETELDAIYGELFEWSGKNTIVPDLASGWTLTNHDSTLTIDLRPGVTFQDGTPFNAAAVVFNLQRDFNPKNACSCDSRFPVKSVAAVGNTKVVMQLKQPYLPILSSFLGTAPNWIVSPTALTKLGEAKFALNPVGAGPFEVVKDVQNSELITRRFSKYWQKGRPYLNGLTFRTVANDETAYEAMLAGQGNAYEDLATIPLVSTEKAHFNVESETPTEPYFIEMNETHAPFNDLRARQAIYYATDPAAIDKSIFDDYTPVTQSFTAPGGLFYDPKVPGYPGYDPSKAKALVKQVGGLSFSIMVDSIAPWTTLATALSAEYEAVGMKVTIDAVTLPEDIKMLDANDWQLAMAAVGTYDPALGLTFRLASSSPYSGVHDPTLDQMMNQAASTTSTAARRQEYRSIAEYLAKNADGAFLFPEPYFDVSAKNVHGPGFTTPITVTNIVPLIPWEQVWLS